MRARPTPGSLLVLLTSCGVLLAASTAFAQDGDEDAFGVANRSMPLVQAGKTIEVKSGADGTEINLSPRRIVVVRLDAPIRSVSEFDESLLRVSSSSPDRVAVQANSVGETDLVLTDENGAETRIKVRVKSEVPARLQALIQELFPDAEVQLHDVNGAVLVRGTAANSDDIANINEVAKQFYPQVLMQAEVKQPADGMTAPFYNPGPSPARPGPSPAQPFSRTTPAQPDFAAPPYGPVTPAPVRKPLDEIREPEPQVAPAYGAPVTRPVPDTGQSNLRSEIRALHADVKRLIELLESRQSTQSPTM
ncbi:MAG: pilus assembly protein N-terminal domain-containing protein [Planctomycetaceae bacterium]